MASSIIVDLTYFTFAAASFDIKLAFDTFMALRVIEIFVSGARMTGTIIKELSFHTSMAFFVVVVLSFRAFVTAVIIFIHSFLTFVTLAIIEVSLILLTLVALSVIIE